VNGTNVTVNTVLFHLPVSPIAVAVLHVGHAVAARLHLLVAALGVAPVPHLIVVRLAVCLVGKLKTTIQILSTIPLSGLNHKAH